MRFYQTTLAAVGTNLTLMAFAAMEIYLTA